MICACISLKTLTMPRSVRLCLNIHVSVPTLGELHQPGEELTSAVITTTELWWMSLDSSLLSFLFLVLLNYSLIAIVKTVCIVFLCSCDVPLQYGAF